MVVLCSLVASRAGGLQPHELNQTSSHLTSCSYASRVVEGSCPRSLQVGLTLNPKLDSAGKAVWGLHLLVGQARAGEVVQGSTPLSGGISWLPLPLEKHAGLEVTHAGHCAVVPSIII